MDLIYVHSLARKLLTIGFMAFLVTDIYYVIDRVRDNSRSEGNGSRATAHVHNILKEQPYETSDTHFHVLSNLESLTGKNDEVVCDGIPLYPTTDEGNLPESLKTLENTEPMKNGTIDNMIAKLRSVAENSVFPEYFWNSSLADLTKRFGDSTRNAGKRLKDFTDEQTPRKLMPWENSRITEKEPNWRLFHRGIRQFALYKPDNPAIDALLHDMATREIVRLDDDILGTQLKLVFNFDDGGKAIFKPMRYPREVGANPNHLLWDDFERHVAEIAAFHLDRILGFYRVPPTIGRIVNITEEILPLASESFSETFFTSPAGNLCFYGDCELYCDSAHAFCGNPDMIEGSVMSYLPLQIIAPRNWEDQPWKRAYSQDEGTDWETDDTFCETVRQEPPYNNGKYLLDIIDAHTFDFLTGNKDRHSFDTFAEFNFYTFPIMFDNGEGFGHQDHDSISILTPLRQCCMIRRSTFLKYVRLYLGPDKLSRLMSESLASDPVAPVLLPGYLKALDRRVKKILLTVANCLARLPDSEVIINDNF